jgi:hypothetical protein
MYDPVLDIGLFNGRRLVYEGQEVDDENNTEFPGCLLIDTGWNEWAWHVTDKVLYEIVGDELVRKKGDWSMRRL